MRNTIRRAISAVSALCIAGSVCMPVLAKDYSYIRKDEISGGLTFTTETIKRSMGAGSRAYIYDYTPGGTTMPIVAYGDKLYGKSDVNDVVDYCRRQGYTVMAAFNADFFSMSTGVPTGIVVREGRLCSSDGSWNAVGFMQDGRAICGSPKLDITFSVNGGQRFPIAAFNKVRDSKGIYLYSSDYGTSTHLTAAGPVAILKKADSADYMTIGGSIALTVVEAGTSSGESKLDDDTFVLTHQAAVSAGIDITALQPGDLVMVYTGTRSEGWDGVYYACGAGDAMIEKSVLTSNASNSVKGPRTMLGIRNDGSIAILVCDGRSNGTADGMTLREAAMKLYEMGCKDVINLDGGGSSVASARYPGQADVPVISAPSDGSPRKCANFIVFVNTGDRNEDERYVSVYPKDALVLAGGSIELSGYSYNSSYYPGNKYDDGFYVVSGGGEIDGNLLTVPERGGTVTVGADIYGLTSVNADIISVDTPETMTVSKKGSTAELTSLSLEPGGTIDLDVTVTDGLRKIASKDEQFTFSVTGNIGTIEPDGKFTAVDVQGISGTIEVAFGSVKRSVAVTVGKAPEVISGFESKSSYNITASEGASASASVSLTGDNARYGKGSLLMSFSGGSDTVTYTAHKVMSIKSGMKQLTLAAKGSGEWYIDFNTSSGIVSSRINVSGAWNFTTVDIPSGASSIAGFHASGESGQVYVDQIVGHYGIAQLDTEPPAIEMLNFDGDLNVRISDDGRYPIGLSNIKVMLDGNETKNITFDPTFGTLNVVIPQDGLLHRVTIEVSDSFGNLARFGTESEGACDGPFGDMAGHWGEKYANYLWRKGVFTADETFRPQASATNEMVATIISRYMGIDTDRYEDVELPYADIDKIHDWALPHIKALYSLGIMQGGSDSSGNVWFYPGDAANRSRVMTVMGRTLSRGYFYNEASYADMAEAPEWSVDNISLLSALGVVNGYGGENRVAPSAGITRAEIAAILYRLY